MDLIATTTVSGLACVAVRKAALSEKFLPKYHPKNAQVYSQHSKLDAQGSLKEPKWIPKAAPGSPNRVRGAHRFPQKPRREPKGIPKVIQGGPCGSHMTPVASETVIKMELKRVSFRDRLNMRILKDVPYGINDFGGPEPQESDPKSSQEP